MSCLNIPNTSINLVWSINTFLVSYLPLLNTMTNKEHVYKVASNLKCKIVNIKETFVFY